jgi:hypothetical protein
MMDDRVVEFLSILTPAIWLFQDPGSAGSDGRVDSRIVAAMYDGISNWAFAR